MLLPKTKEEFDKQLSDIQQSLDSSEIFFSILNENKLTARDIAKVIDVNKYDEVTKDFDPIQYYIAFEKRREALDILENIEALEKETYEEYLNSGSEELTEEEFIEHRKSEIKLEKFELREFVGRIIAGDNAAIYQEDLAYVNGWHLQTPIRLFDMREVAFENQRNGLLGGMDDAAHNEILCRMISGTCNSDDLSKFRDMPEGYGWPKLGLNQRVWAEIDVNTPDDILIEAFKKFLIEARSHSHFSEDIPYHLFSKGEVKSSHIKKWHSLRVLAYLDLKIFSTILGVKLTMKQYGDIIYFDNFDIDNTEKVRKTLIPLVSEILSSGYLNNLLKKIIAEN